MLKDKKDRKIICRNCKKSSFISISEEEYDYEISCFNCGDLWWVEKKEKHNLTGDDLKYVSYNTEPNTEE